MTEQQISEIEKGLGRRLTPEERRLLRYTEKETVPVPEKRPDPVKRKKAAQSK